MNCKIIYKGISYDESDFKNQIERYVAINNLFNENESLANAVYEVLGFNNVITPNDKIIWGHPAIGKTTAKEQKGFLDFDTDFKPLVAQKLGLPKSQQNSLGLNEWRKATGNEEAFNSAMREVWTLAKEQSKAQNKILMVSDMIFLRENQSDFDKIINLPSTTFINRAIQRGDNTENLQNWKNKIDSILKNVDSKKIITTDKYLSDLFITPQQKQQAQQLYSQYLDSLNKPNTNPILKDNQKPDVILPIGTSGSGKSTFIKSLPQENLVVIEPDAMRVEFTGDMNNKSKDKEIYIEAANRAIQAIKQGKQVVFDTTNLTKDKRIPFIEAIKKAIPTANIQYKLMELNPELAKQRIKAQLERGENRAAVSDETIDRHAESYKQMLEDIKSEPISNYDIQQEQVKKFTELQERLNNKEFLEGAKFAYESTPELQQFGTQEQYNDYIARVSLGIIKNPSSGEYNYNSKVKDIVYHGSPSKHDVFKTVDENAIEERFKHRGAMFTSDKNYVNAFGENLYNVVLNIKNPVILSDNMGINSAFVATQYYSVWKNENKDGVIGHDALLDLDHISKGTEYVVFEPEQIHILSSKTDIQGFKDWISNSKLSDSNQQNNNSKIENKQFYQLEDVGQKGVTYIGNFSEDGKGTFEGDGKDKQMRKDSVGFIGELNPNKEDRFESSTYGSFKHFSNENTIEEDRYLQSLPTKIKQGDKIMLALNGSINDKDILNKTKEKISELNEQGVTFLMGDMPHSKIRLGDSNFLNYIRSIKGKYVVYGNGSKSRIDNLKPNELEDVTQEEWDNLTEQEKNKIMECL